MRFRGIRSAGLFAVIVLIAQCGHIFAKGSALDTVYRYSLLDSSGTVVPLANYRGKVLLIVNLASKSVFDSQVAKLEDLAQKEGPKGLVVIGIPSDDFGGEEPDNDAAIQNHYRKQVHITFPLMAKSSVRGKDEIPLYTFLTENVKDKTKTEDVHWSYTKFLIDRSGKVAGRFEAGVSPDDPSFLIAVDAALKGPCDPKCKPKVTDKEEAAGEDDRDR